MQSDLSDSGGSAPIPNFPMLFGMFSFACWFHNRFVLSGAAYSHTLRVCGAGCWFGEVTSVFVGSGSRTPPTCLPVARGSDARLSRDLRI